MNCIYYLAGYCQLQREHFCEYNQMDKCPKYLVDNSPEKMTSVLVVVPSLDTYNYLEVQEDCKRIATGRLSDVVGIKIVRKKE